VPEVGHNAPVNIVVSSMGSAHGQDAKSGMNEQQARDVALVRAIETSDTKLEVLSADDRMYASRSARELAQWQAADSHTQVTHEHFLQQRAEQIINRVGERTPSM
jgi:hypothetical protein